MSKYFLGVEIEVNHHCNLACHYCPNSNTERINKGLMSLEQFRNIMNQLQDIGYEGRISYHFYNEPLLHPHLEKMIRMSKEILPKTMSEVFTNGTLLTMEKYKKLREAGVDKFTVTRHKGNDRISFDETFEHLSDAEKSHVQFYDHSKIIYTSRGGLVDYGSPIANPSQRMCLIPTCSLVITVNGNVVTCYEDYKEKNVMGNLFNEHLRDIWEKPEYLKFREDLRLGHRYKYDVCKTCNNFKVIQ